MKQMKQWLLLVVAVAMVVVIGGCRGGKASPEAVQAVQSNTPMYTQVGMWYEQNKRGVNIVNGTNYNVGMFIPANSKVTLLGAIRQGVVIDYKGQRIELHNISKYTGIGNTAFMERMLGKKPVNLSKFNKVERSAIAKGTVVKGMRKDAVLVSRGYPPAHATPSLEAEKWRYWKNRWATMYVVFSTNGRVTGFVE